MELFNKLIFLYKSKASFIIYMIFLKTKITNILFKRKIKDKKKSHKRFLITKKITQDYFSSHASLWILFSFVVRILNEFGFSLMFGLEFFQFQE